MAQDHENDSRMNIDEQALELAETTDVSLKQAKELIDKYGLAEAKQRAKNYKAES